MGGRAGRSGVTRPLAASPALPAPPSSPHDASTAELEPLCPGHAIASVPLRSGEARETRSYVASSAEMLGLAAASLFAPTDSTQHGSPLPCYHC